MKTLIIKTSQWLYGNREKSCLRNAEGKMCCLGFLGLACGAKEEELLNKGSPASLPNIKWTEGLLWFHNATNSITCITLMSINDSLYITPEQRKDCLKEEFKKIGINVEFID